MTPNWRSPTGATSNVYYLPGALMGPDAWEWVVESYQQYHSERVAMMREILYEAASVIDEEGHDEEGGEAQKGKALSINISSGGMLLLMPVPLRPERVLRVHVPTPVGQATTPTLAEVRWVRQVPFTAHLQLHFVGVKFLC